MYYLKPKNYIDGANLPSKSVLLSFLLSTYGMFDQTQRKLNDQFVTSMNT